MQGAGQGNWKSKRGGSVKKVGMMGDCRTGMRVCFSVLKTDSEVQ